MSKKTPGEIFAEMLKARDENKDTSQLEKDFVQSTNEHFKNNGISINCEFGMEKKKE
mgnify:CR=1 FL=1